ncbi:MAG: tetratricopeptide repeat protein [Terricaulis sp.]
MRWRVLAVCVLALAACSKPADPLARARTDCAEADLTPVMQAAACSKLIETGQLADEDHAVALAHRGEAQARGGETTAALRDFTAALGLDADNMAAVRGRADILIKSGQLDAAEPLVERLVASGQFTAEAHFMQGKIAALRSNFPAAIAAYDAAIADNARYVEAFTERADVKKAQGDKDGAGADLDSAINIDPHFAAARADRCWLRLQRQSTAGEQRDDTGAREDANAAVAADPHSFEGQLCLGLLQARAGDWSNARASFDVAVNLQPGNAMALFGRGVARKRAGDGAGQQDMNQARDFDHAIDGKFIDLGVATY